MRRYNQDRLILHIHRASLYNMEKPLFVLYNKKEAFIKSICFFAIGCALLSITREQLPLAFLKNSELKNIILFFGTFVSGFYLIFSGLMYDNIYCALIKTPTSNIKSKSEIFAFTLTLFSFFMLSGHLWGTTFALILGALTMIGIKIIYIYSEVI